MRSAILVNSVGKQNKKLLYMNQAQNIQQVLKHCNLCVQANPVHDLSHVPLGLQY